MAEIRDIRRLHLDIEERIVQLTGQRGVEIRPRSRNWKHASSKARISFDAHSNDYFHLAGRRIGGCCPVFPLKAALSFEDNQAWVGWHEEWQCVLSGKYDLVGAGWTFFWGVCGRLTEEQQLFRAEWDETKYRGGVAPQPHWHLDTDILVGYTTRAVRTVRSSTLLELPAISDPVSALREISPAEGLQEISLGKMHLGMGGWSNCVRHPEWWQRHVGEDWNAMADWAERTLQSAIDQFENLTVTDRFE